MHGIVYKGLTLIEQRIELLPNGLVRMVPIRVTAMLIQTVVILTVLDVSLSERPCYVPSDKAKFDSMTKSLQSVQRDLSALRVTYRGRNVYSKSCGIGWKGYGEHCYMLSSTPETWYNGAKSCHDKGASLVYIENTEENSWVSNLCTQAYCWIGAHDLKEDYWLWSYNWTEIKYKNWNTSAGEPNGGVKENCGWIYGTKDNRMKKWNDSSCDLKLHYICKREHKHRCPTRVTNSG